MAVMKQDRKLDSGICMDSSSAAYHKTIDSVPKLSNRSDDFFCESVEINNRGHAEKMLQSLMKHLKPEKKHASDVVVEEHNHLTTKHQSTTPGESRRLLHQRLRESLRLKRAMLREQARAARKLDEEKFSISEDEEVEMTDGETSVSESGCEDDKLDEQNSNKIAANNRDKTMDCMGKLEVSDSEDEVNGDQLVDDQSTERVGRSQLPILGDCKQNGSFTCHNTIDFTLMSDLFDANGSDNEFGDGSASEDRSSQGDGRSELTGTRPFAMFSSQTAPRSDACSFLEYETSAPQVSDSNVVAQFPVLGHMHSNASSTDSMCQARSRRSTPDMFSQPPLSRTGSLFLSHKFPMPVEDSQDLYNDTEMSLLPAQRPLSEEARLQMEDTLCMADEDTCLFDSQGFFKKRTNHRTSTWICSRAPSFATAVSTASNSQDSSNNMEELLGLCSGTFSSRTQVCSDDIITSTAFRATEPGMLNESAIDADSNEDPMHELIGLCSGKFPSQVPDFTNNITGKDNFAADDDNDNSQSDKDEHLIPTKGIKMSTSRLPELRKSLRAAQLAQFLEDEAELSGSDAASSDDDDNSDLDEYEADPEADEEIALLTHINLQKQIEKIHHKEMLMQDREEVEAFKDRYLGEDYEEGLDLKTGLFRSKRYVRQSEEGSQTDLFSQADASSLPDEDKDDSCSQLETERRRQRFERDNFLKEERLKERNGFLLEHDENSQIILNMIKDENNSNATTTNYQPKKAVLMCPVTPKAYNKKMSKAGSFLKRSKTCLNRLSAATTQVPNLNGATRKFVFESVGTDHGNKQGTALSAVNKTLGGNCATVLSSSSRGRKLDRSNSVFSELQYKN